jgi:hypothetical protein
MRRIVALVLMIGLVSLLGSPAATAQGRSAEFPAVIDLPDGFFPEGIAVGRGSTFFAGSLADGSIFRGDLRTGEGQVLTDAFGPFTTVGLDVDARNRVWVAGGPSGTARLYDGDTGALLQVYPLTAPFASFVNDVIVTPDAAWFTDSGTQNLPPPPPALSFAGSPRLFKVPLQPGGGLPDPSEVEVIDVDVPDVAFPNLNGIETAPGGLGLLVAHTTVGDIYAVDPNDGQASPVYTDGLVGADGLVRKGTDLYVVENGAAQISRLRVNPATGLASLAETYPVPGAETPTTAALFGNNLYAVDARFGSMAGPYRVYQVPR